MAKPPVITAISSERVILPTYERIRSGASVWPTKMLAEADSDSGPDVPITFVMTTAKTLTTRWMTPRW